MSLRSDVESLRDATVTALAEAHDHFVYTAKVWDLMSVDIRRHGRRLALSNPVTGSRHSGRDLLPISRIAVTSYLPVAAIQQFVSLTETFLADLVRLWVTAYPAHLKGQVDVQVIVAAPDKAAILRPLIDQYVLAMAYNRPNDWFRQLNSIVALGCPATPEVEQFAEFKATRDVFAHNRGVVSETYLDKSGSLARAAVGQPLDLPAPYLDDGWRLCRKVVTDAGGAAALRA